MAWLTVPEDRASPELEQLTLPWRTRGEQVPPVMGVLKQNPRAFEAVLGLNYAVTFGASSLGRRREELIAIFVSALNDCFFCLATHARYLEGMCGATESEFAALLGALRDASQRFRAGDSAPLRELRAVPGLEPGEAELLSFVAELSVAPEDTDRARYQTLRDAGYSEREVLDAVLVTACFAFMNRLACGTGVALDESKHVTAIRMFGRAELERHLAWAALATDRA